MGQTTLEELHLAIQAAVDFDNDHLYAFFVARNDRSSSRVNYDDENGRIYHTQIANMFPLPPKNHLFYLFDYGDYWIFKIFKSRKAPHEPVDGVDYPRVVKESGEKPVQYGIDEDEFGEYE